MFFTCEVRINIYGQYRVSLARWPFFFFSSKTGDTDLHKKIGIKKNTHAVLTRHNLTSKSGARLESFRSHSSWRVMASGWHLERRTLQQDARGERRRALRVHVALGGPISVAVVKSRLFFLVGGVIKGKKKHFICPGDSTVGHFKQRWPSGKKTSKKNNKKKQ